MKILVNIDVPELAPAIEFYQSALGLRLTRMLDEDVAELGGATAMLYLLKKPPLSNAVEGKDIERLYTRHWTPVHIDFVVDNVEQAAQRALQAGARREGGCAEWRGSKCITFADPFGNGFCLIEFAGDTYRSGDI